jgi:chaperonin cofactor prefoldin
VRLRGGDGFLRVGKDDAEAELEALADAQRARLAGLEGELKGVQAGMAALKRELKAKFGDSINLEE